MMTPRIQSCSLTAVRTLIVPSLAIATALLTPCFAQVQLPAPPPNRSARAPRRQPCWQQVGLSKETIEQRRSIEHTTRSQVESVCADASLTPQQKHQKIKEIRQQARQQIDAIITPQQQEELRGCQVERAGNRPNPPRHQGGGARGPCGETTAAAPEPSEDKAPPSNAPEPKQP